MPPVNTFTQGAVGTGDRVSDIHAESWNPAVHKALPYHKFPMMTIMDAMAKGSGTISSRKHHWWEEAWEPYHGAILDVYTNASLATAYVSGGVEGTALYIAVTAAHAAQVREGDDILITNTTNNTLRVVRTIGVQITNDTTSYIAVTLAETDTGNILAQTDLSWGTMADAQAEGSELPTAISHDPQGYENVTQIMMESIEHTGSELSESQRISGSKREKSKRDAMSRFKMKEEWANLFGIYKIGTGSNSKRKSHMRGAYQAISTNDPTNIIDWRTASGYSGTFLNSGLNWIKEVAKDASVYSEATAKTCFAGHTAWAAISDAVEDRGYFKLETRQTAFGIKIKTLVGLTQDWNIILCPTMSLRGFGSSMFVTEMDLIRKKVFRPLKFVKANDRNDDGYTFVDAKKEGFYQETTQEIVNTRTMRWLDGIGEDHS